MASYLETSIEGNGPVIWAYRNPDALEIDLRAYYGNSYKRMRIRSVGEESARRTEGWHTEMFTQWNSPRARREVKRAFCLGALVKSETV